MWRLQGGSYIPGFSGQAYGAGLQRDVTKTRKDQAKKAAALQKYMSKRGSLGKWAGNIVGAGVGVGLGAMGMGPLGLTIGKTLGAGLGSRLGSSKMISGEGPSMAPGAGTGLLGSTYEQLGEAKGGIDEAMRGQAYGAGAAQLMSGLTGVAGDKLGGQLGDMFGKWKASTGRGTGFEGTGIGNTFGLDIAGTRTPSLPGYEGYGGLSLNPTELQSGGNIGGAYNRAFGLSKPSLKTGSRLSDAGKFISEYKPGQTKGWMAAVDKLASDTDARRKDLDELGGMGAPEESMLERIKGAAGSMFNPFHGVEKEAPMQQYAQQLSPEIMSLLEEYGGKDVPEREPFDLMGNLGGLRKGAMGKLGGLGRGAGNVLSSMFNPFHGMETESPRSSWTGLPMQMGGMMPGGVSNALPYQEGGLMSVMLSKLSGAGRRQGAYEENVPPRQQLPSMPEGGVNWMAPLSEGLETPQEAYERSGEEDRQMLRKFQIGYDEKGLPMPQDVNIPQGYQGGGEAEEDQKRVDNYYNMQRLARYMGEDPSLSQEKRYSILDMMGPEFGGDPISKDEEEYNLWALKSRLANYMGEDTTLSPEKRSSIYDTMGPEYSGVWPESKQMGGSISPYNLGGSVTQQPMAYQLGGLLKYKRSPMMG